MHIDYATLNRWVVKYAPLIAAEAQKRKSVTGRSWRMDETYVKVKSRWAYLYRVVDREGNTLDFMLSERRNEATATVFFTRAIHSNGWSDKVVIDKSGTNLASLENMNILLILSGWVWLIEVLQVKYLNNIVEQGPPLYQEADPANAGLQILRCCAGDRCRDREHAYDPKGSTCRQRQHRLSAVRGAGRITVSSKTLAFSLRIYLRHNPTKPAPFIVRSISSGEH